MNSKSVCPNKKKVVQLLKHKVRDQKESLNIESEIAE